MPEVTADDVAWLDDSPLEDIYCLTFIKGVDEGEALRRMGALPDTLRPRTVEDVAEDALSFDAGYPRYAFALNLGAWTVVIEPGGFEGAGHTMLPALSTGTEAVTVLRHDYAADHFAYAVDGTYITGFEPLFPDQRWGDDPDRLLDQMRAAGFDPDDEDANGLPQALVLAGLITGVVLRPDAISDELASAEIESWFSAAAPESGINDPGLIEASKTAPPQTLRAVAAGEANRLAALLGLADTPGLTEAIAAAERGERVTVPVESELGGHVRAWLRVARQAGQSLNLAPSRMTDAERDDGYMLGWFTSALEGALWHEPRAAVRAALRPLIDGPPRLRDAAAEAAVRAALGL
jgi:hypothetical protein